MLIQGMRAQRVDDGLGGRLAHGHGGDVERGRLVGLAHVARPLRMEVVAALALISLGLCGFKALVVHIKVALDHDF